MSTQTTVGKYEPSLSLREQVELKTSLEHDWLGQFVGEWETELECPTEPGKPPMKSTERRASALST